MVLKMMNNALHFEPGFVQALYDIDWFANCGQGLPESLTTGLPFEVAQVATETKAQRQWASSQWEDATLEARNLLTDALGAKAQEPHQQWNQITVQAKAEVLQPLAEKFWQPYMQQHGLHADFLHCVQWDVLGLCMEHAYREQRGLPQFFHALLKVYAAGHFPCGWEGGKYPEGQLLVW